MEVTLGKLAEAKVVHPSKTLLPNDVTELLSYAVRDEQFRKAMQFQVDFFATKEEQPR